MQRDFSWNSNNLASGAADSVAATVTQIQASQRKLDWQKCSETRRGLLCHMNLSPVGVRFLHVFCIFWFVRCAVRDQRVFHSLGSSIRLPPDCNAVLHLCHHRHAGGFLCYTERFTTSTKLCEYSVCWQNLSLKSFPGFLQLFGNIGLDDQTPINRHNNFHTFFNALTLLFRWVPLLASRNGKPSWTHQQLDCWIPFPILVYNLITGIK